MVNPVKKAEKPKESVTKAYKLPSIATSRKQSAVADLSAVYTAEYRKHIHAYWVRFKRGELTAFSYFGSPQHLASPLSASYLQGCLARAARP